MSSRSYILQIMLWHQSLKNIHYKMLLIFQNKKTTDLRVKHGGDKRHVIPSMSKHGGDISPPSPPGFTPLAFITLCNIFGMDSTNFRKYSAYIGTHNFIRTSFNVWMLVECAS